MSEHKASDYWAALLVQIREAYGWSQEQLANELGVSRETISRWEKEQKYPSELNRTEIGKLASRANLETVFGIIQVVEVSPFPMILTDADDFVLAASKTSGFVSGRTVVEQTPADEQDTYIKFSEMVKQSGFWQKAGNCFEYEFEVDGIKRKAVVQSVGSRGHIFALVQKL